MPGFTVALTENYNEEAIGMINTFMRIKSLLLVELVNRRGNLKPLDKKGLLSLETDVTGPFCEAGQITLSPVTLG